MNTKYQTKKTLKTYIQSEYIPFLKIKRDKESSLKKDLGVLTIIMEYPLVKKSMASINANDLEAFFGRLRSDRCIQNATVNRYRSQLQAIFNHAKKARLLSWNPVGEIRREKESSRNRCLSPKEIANLLDYCRISQNKELYNVVMFALYTGMRLNEVLGLKVSNIQGNVIKLRANQTKSKAVRTIAMHNHLSVLIKDILANKASDDYIFDTTYIRRSFTTAVKKANIHDFRFHDLRRTFATYLVDMGISHHVVRQLLGHSSIQMTEVYLAGNFQKNVDAIEKLCFV